MGTNAIALNWHTGLTVLSLSLSENDTGIKGRESNSNSVIDTNKSRFFVHSTINPKKKMVPSRLFCFSFLLFCCCCCFNEEKCRTMQSTHTHTKNCKEMKSIRIARHGKSFVVGQLRLWFHILSLYMPTCSNRSKMIHIFCCTVFSFTSIELNGIELKDIFHAISCRFVFTQTYLLLLLLCNFKRKLFHWKRIHFCLILKERPRESEQLNCALHWKWSTRNRIEFREKKKKKKWQQQRDKAHLSTHIRQVNFVNEQNNRQNVSVFDAGLAKKYDIWILFYSYAWPSFRFALICVESNCCSFFSRIMWIRYRRRIKKKFMDGSFFFNFYLIMIIINSVSRGRNRNEFLFHFYIIPFL